MMFSYGCDIFDSRSTFENNEINTSQPLDGTYGGIISSTYAFIMEVYLLETVQYTEPLV